MDCVVKWLNRDGYRKQTLDVNEGLLEYSSCLRWQRDYSTDCNMAIYVTTIVLDDEFATRLRFPFWPSCLSSIRAVLFDQGSSKPQMV
jgi:hypothetical protein